MILTNKIQIVRTNEQGKNEWVKKTTQSKKMMMKTTMTRQYLKSKKMTDLKMMRP